MASQQPVYSTRGSILIFKKGDTITAPLFNLRFEAPEEALDTAPGTMVSCDIIDSDDGTFVCRFEWTELSVAVKVGTGTLVTYTRSNFYLKHIDENGIADTDYAEITFFMEEAESLLLPITTNFTYEIKYQYPIGSGKTDVKTLVHGTGCIVPQGTEAVAPLT